MVIEEKGETELTHLRAARCPCCERIAMSQPGSFRGRSMGSCVGLL